MLEPASDQTKDCAAPTVVQQRRGGSPRHGTWRTGTECVEVAGRAKMRELRALLGELGDALAAPARTPP